MMKKLVLTSLLAASVSAASASAADLSRGYLAPAPYSAFSWAGAYVGANLGYQFTTVHNSGADPHGFMGGAQLGYNWQNDQFVYGVEGDLQFSNADGTAGGAKFLNPWFGTVRGRAGFAMNNILLYGTGGLAFGEGKVEAGGSESHSHFGWTAGAGAEVALAPHWSARVEYLFVNLTDERYALTGLEHDFESSLLRFGFNYRF
ncbi:MAG TPA: outer membrane protein [Xanthobacteraceae bacterium]|nr:outer membrane protein [Xanthobacteraceae bacterium]